MVSMCKQELHGTYNTIFTVQEHFTTLRLRLRKLVDSKTETVVLMEGRNR